MNRPYAYDVISVGRPHLVEVKRMLFIGQYCAPRVQIRASRLFRHLFSSKMAAGWRQCIRPIMTFTSVCNNLSDLVLESLLHNYELTVE